MKTIYLYARTSTKDQKYGLDTQIQFMTDNLPSGPFTPEIIKEQLSGKSLDGRMLSKILDALQEGDMIFAYDISRISRDTADLLQILKKIWSKKGRIKIGL